MLRDANIQVILDHHALPGVQTPDQMFTGQYVFHRLIQYSHGKTDGKISCTNIVQFYVGSLIIILFVDCIVSLLR
jgi:hypothetical protein